MAATEAVATATGEITIEPLTPRIGAIVRGVELSQPLPRTGVDAIRGALLRWKVVFFHDQDIGPAEHIRFGELFGSVSPGHPTLPGLEGFPQVLPLSNRSAVDARGEALIESEWHTDVTFTVRPPMGSILPAVEIPPYGGDTQWSNLVAAYERLSPPLRSMLDGLHAVHRNTLHVERPSLGLPSELRSIFSGRPLAALHPVVRVHPETGERALFVNPTFTSHIVELSRAESNALLAFLYAHIQAPELTVRFRWEPGSIAFWDNRCTAHLAPRDVMNLTDGEGRPVVVDREMQRIALDGDVPIGVDGAAARELDGSGFL